MWTLDEAGCWVYDGGISTNNLVMAQSRPLRAVSVLLGAFVLLFAIQPAALAGRPFVDSGVGLAQEDSAPYDKAQEIPGSIFGDSRAVHGKLRGDVPVDIYKFVPDQDGDLLISLLVFEDEFNRGADPAVFLMDPNENADARDFGFPLPADTYQTVLLSRPQEFRTVNEPALFEQFYVVAEQTISLKKDQVYYLVILDSQNAIERYAIKFGTEAAWSGGDVFKYFGTWLSLKTDTYGGGNPFNFGPKELGYLLFVLGLGGLLGFWVLQSVFFWAGRNAKAMAYLLVKYQPVERIAIWISLWFTALGGYLTFAGSSWAGIPFMLILMFVPLAAFQLVETIVLSPQIMKLEVAKREASLPGDLQKKLYITFGGTAAFLIAFLAFLSMRPLS